MREVREVLFSDTDRSLFVRRIHAAFPSTTSRHQPPLEPHLPPVFIPLWPAVVTLLSALLALA